MAHRLISAVFVAILAASGSLRADAPAGNAPDLPPAYTAQAQPLTGTIRIWGHGAYAGRQDFIEALTRKWEAGFQKYYPDVRFETRLTGTAAAIGSLYTGVGDIALMGREIWPNELAGFDEVFHYPPTGIDVVTGSFDVRNHGYAIVIFVNRKNPIGRMTLSQLDAVFSASHRRSGKAARTWGDLGLEGEWKNRAIHPYGLSISRGFAEYFEDAVFDSARLWNPEMREFSDQPGSKGGDTDGGQQLVDALGGDPQGIGYAGLLYHNADVKPVALAARDGEAYVEPTRGSVLDHSYPLTRKISMFINRAPGHPVDPKLKEFLRYVLSREGQQAVSEYGGGYLPMLAPLAKTELEKLEDRP